MHFKILSLSLQHGWFDAWCVTCLCICSSENRTHRVIMTPWYARDIKKKKKGAGLYESFHVLTKASNTPISSGICFCSAPGASSDHFYCQGWGKPREHLCRQVLSMVTKQCAPVLSKSNASAITEQRETFKSIAKCGKPMKPK